MIENEVIRTMLDHRSVRKYRPDMPSDEIIHTVVRAGQQAPFAYQCYSIILSRGPEKVPFDAPLLFTICVDIHKLEKIMEKRGWQRITNDLNAFLFAVEDASYAAQNMVIAGRSLGLGSCFIGGPLAHPGGIIKKYNLPSKVYPIVQLTMGYPDEDRPTRPRFPMDFVLFEDGYPELDDDILERAIKEMDDGYLAQEYYKKINYMVDLGGSREEKYDFDTYGWTEHISRKFGLWGESLEEQRKAIKDQGFEI